MTKDKVFSLYTDGGARGNPGPAAIGVVLSGADGKELATIARAIGISTNNVAEYSALLAGLELAQVNKVRNLICYLDSELVVKQLNREYKVKDVELAKLFIRVWNVSQKFKEIAFKHVPREKNKRADGLVNQALDQ